MLEGNPLPLFWNQSPGIQVAPAVAPLPRIVGLKYYANAHVDPKVHAVAYVTRAGFHEATLSLLGIGASFYSVGSSEYTQIFLENEY